MTSNTNPRSRRRYDDPGKFNAWLTVIARAAITAACIGVGVWLVVAQQADMGYSFITFVAGYWLK